MKSTTRRAAMGLTAAITVLLIGGCAAVPPQADSAPRPRVTTARLSTAPGSMNGVFEQGVPGSYTFISEFAATTGTTPRLALYYSGWWEKFQAGFAATARQHGTIPFVQLQPDVPLTSILKGYSDRYLRSYADAVEQFGHPVILSFGHEMNGRWYSWGAGHETPMAFIDAWRHIVSVFRDEGASNVTWLWTVNSVNAASSNLRQWWPGTAYVNWIGIDGYYYRPSDTFSGVFGRTVNDIRGFTNDPVLISETAVAPGPNAAEQVKGLFAGAKADRLLGVVWFDESQHQPPYHLAWRLEDDPAALAAYKEAVR